MLKLKIVFQIVIILFVLNSCKKKEILVSYTTDNPAFDLPTRSKTKEEFKKSRYFSEDLVKDFKHDVMQTGSTDAYGSLRLYYGYNFSKRHELLPYTLMMVEKHKKYDYCSDAFENLFEFYTGKGIYCFYKGTYATYIPYFKRISTLEPQVQKYCLYFLELGCKNNDAGCIEYSEIMHRFGLGYKKNIKKADSLKVAFQNQLKIISSEYL